MDLALLITGAVAGGFINGLAGFGTALFTLGFWLQILPPVQAVALVLVVSTATGLQGLLVVRRHMAAQKHRLARFLVPALFGIPIGIGLLTWIDPRTLKLVVAGFLILYGVFFIARRRLPDFDKQTHKRDAGIGFLGGILGGLAGLSGALPAMWLALRPWPRHETRAVLQPYNVAILAISMVILAAKGVYTGAVIRDVLIVLPVSIVSAQIGIRVFSIMSDTKFRWLLIFLMLASGLLLATREIL